MSDSSWLDYVGTVNGSIDAITGIAGAIMDIARR